MKAALRVSISYLILGVAWIYFSDIAVSLLFRDRESLRLAQSYKGWVFVFASSILIFFLLRRELNKEYDALKEKNKNDLLYQNVLKQIQDSVIVFNLKTWKIELLSYQTAKFFELTRDEILHDSMKLVERLHPEDRDRMLDIWSNKLTENFAGVLYRLKFPDGRIKWALENRLYVFDPEENEGRAISITTDITDYIQKQALLEESLKENKILLTEVHHRVKNNLSVIISFLQLQSFSAPEESTIVLEQSIARIKAIALVHEKLYAAKNLSSLDAADYVIGLVENIKLMYMRLDVTVNLNIDSKDLSLIDAIPLGLMVTEMLTNSFRHAFPSNKDALISIRLIIEDSGRMELIYKDNGKGFPRGVNIRDAETVGLSVIFSLCSQMSGREVSIFTAPNEGVLYHFEFLPKNRKTLE
jgi:two-component sensor histidine kinase/PAS domain-containing protein